MSGFQPALEPLRPVAVAAAAPGDAAPLADTQYKYEGKDDDRPLLWREPLNELQGAINELLAKRKKKLGASISKAESIAPMQDDDQINLNRPRSARQPGRAPRKARSSSRGLRPDSARSRQSNQSDDDADDIDVEDLLKDDGEDLGPPGMGPREEDEDPRVREARLERMRQAKEEFLAKTREVEQCRVVLNSEDVLHKIRAEQSQELEKSIAENEDASEQSHTWIKALEDVYHKRKDKLANHDAKMAKTVKAIEECERALEDLQLERTAAVAQYTRDQALHSNTAKVENKTSDVWRALEEDIRTGHKETEEHAGEKQREQMRISKHLQDLVVGEQELLKRVKAQQQAAEEIEAEGKELHKFWRREYLEEEMVVGGAVAEMEAEDRARSHLAGHGQRIRGKLEQASGTLTAQTAMIEDQTRMDEALKAKTEEVEEKIRAVQAKLDEKEEQREALEKQREDVHLACQDKVEHLNSSLRAIETSANAVATEQVIAQRTLASSEEALESLEAGGARDRLEEDIEALRMSLVAIEARLHEVQKERSAVRETRAKTQRASMDEAAKITQQMEAEDGKVQELLAQRVALEAEQRQLDGQRVVVHARVKQSKKAVTPLEQEKKLYEAELEWVREFEEHSHMRMQEKREAKVVLEHELAELKTKGSRQLQEQTDDEAIIQDGVKAVEELKHKVMTHKAHVEDKLRAVQEALAQHEQDAASLAATMQALDGKIVEAEDMAGEADEKALACKSDWENKDLDWKGRKKEWSQKLKKEQRAQAALQEARGVLKEELDEVETQLTDQRHTALNLKGSLVSLRGEKEMFDSLVAQVPRPRGCLRVLHALLGVAATHGCG